MTMLMLTRLRSHERCGTKHHHVIISGTVNSTDSDFGSVGMESVHYAHECLCVNLDHRCDMPVPISLLKEARSG